MQRNNMALEFASDDIKMDPSFHAAALKKNNSRLLTNYIKGFQATTRRRSDYMTSTQRPRESAVQWRLKEATSTAGFSKQRTVNRSASLTAVGGAILTGSIDPQCCCTCDVN
mmetsp:Transcript_133709/g.333678  ORF Transcript_133709/g.333678 Transcript_133709/m.333678 type:complete len:112 (+) Transcript_133709:2-337(+)